MRPSERKEEEVPSQKRQCEKGLVTCAKIGTRMFSWTKEWEKTIQPTKKGGEL